MIIKSKAGIIRGAGLSCLEVESARKILLVYLSTAINMVDALLPGADVE